MLRCVMNFHCSLNKTVDKSNIIPEKKSNKSHRQKPWIKIEVLGRGRLFSDTKSGSHKGNDIYWSKKDVQLSIERKFKKLKDKH